MNPTDITYKIFEVFESSANEVKKETVVEKFFREYDVKNPNHLKTLDFIIEKIGGINEKIHVFNLLIMACYTFRKDVVDILLSKDANPECARVGVTPLLFLMSNQVEYFMRKSEVEEMKQNILLSLLQHGMSLTVKGDDYDNIAQYAKLRGNLSLLKSIEPHTHILNENQKKEWETLKLQILFC